MGLTRRGGTMVAVPMIEIVMNLPTLIEMLLSTTKKHSLMYRDLCRSVCQNVCGRTSWKAVVSGALIKFVKRDREGASRLKSNLHVHVTLIFGLGLQITTGAPESKYQGFL